jgi:hypothetical protein
VHGLVVARIEMHGFAIFGVKVHVVVVVKVKGVPKPRVSNVLSLETTSSILSTPFDNKTLNIP